MRKCLISLLASVLCILPGVARGGDLYSPVTADDGSQYYIDAESIEHKDNLIYFWIRKVKPVADDKDPLGGFTWTVGNMPFPNTREEAREHRIANCKNNTMATRHYEYFAPTGERTGTLTYPKPSFSRVTPHSASHRMLDMVCR